MARGGRKRKKQGGGKGLAAKLSKQQKHHIKEYGELHPADLKETGNERYKKITDQSPYEAKDESSSSEDSGDAGGSTYQQLVSSLGPPGRQLLQESVETSDEEEEEEGDESQKSSQKTKRDSSGLKVKGKKTASEEEEEKDEEEEEKRENVDDQEEDDGERSQLPQEEDKTEDYRTHYSDSESEDGDEADTDRSVKHATSLDPFSKHFENDLGDKQAESFADKPWQRKEVKLQSLGQCFFAHPESLPPSAINFKEKDLRKQHVKQSLCGQVAATNNQLCQAELSGLDQLTSFQQSLFSVINEYKDLYFADRSHLNGEEVRLVYCLHALNHILKTRSRVIAHNAKIKSKKDDAQEDHRDQGLTRPKVLIVLPFRDSALKVVHILTRLLMPQEQSYVNNKKRFEKEFGLEEDVARGFKPEDFEKTFAGNIDDHFRIGLGIAKKSLKLYTEFYSADIILASPLGLRTIIGAEGEAERDFDFLSSIELLIFDQADVFLMQNWDHMMHLMQHLHLQPKDSHGVDFSRVRMWTLNGWSKYYRQTLVFSGVVCPQVNALFNKQCHNYEGKITVPKPATSGTICQIVTQLPQVFNRVEAESYSQLAEARFQFFINKVLPQHKDSTTKHTLIFVPSYFDFVRLRNYFKKEELDFVQVCEYSKDKSVSRARYFFYHGKTHYMLYTERFHFYRRYRIRGIRHLIFYELPLYPHFYSEMCNYLKDPKKLRDTTDFTCTVLYSRYDAQRLAAVVGTDRASLMVNSEKAVHMFVTGDS